MFTFKLTKSEDRMVVCDDILIVIGETQELKTAPTRSYCGIKGSVGSSHWNWRGSRWNTESSKKGGLTNKQKKYVRKFHSQKTLVQIKNHISCTWTDLWNFLREDGLEKSWEEKQKENKEKETKLLEYDKENDDDTIVVTDEEADKLIVEDELIIMQKKDLSWREELEKVLLAIWVMEDESGAKDNVWIAEQIEELEKREKGEDVDYSNGSIAHALQLLEKDVTSRALAISPMGNCYYFEGASGDIIFDSKTVYFKHRRATAKKLGFKLFNWG